MNLCFFSGIVNNRIDLQFMHYLNNKMEKYVSIVHIDLLVNENRKNKKIQIVKLVAYNEIADWIYQNIKKEDHIILEGKLRNDKIEIRKIGYL